MSAAAKEEAGAFAKHLHRRAGCGVVVICCPVDETPDSGHFAIAGANPHQLMDAIAALLGIVVEQSAAGAACCPGCADRQDKAVAALVALHRAPALDIEPLPEAGSVH